MRARTAGIASGVIAAVLACAVPAAAQPAASRLPNRSCYAGTGPGFAGADSMSASAYAESLAVLNQLDRAVRSRPRDAALWYRRAMVAWALASSPIERARATAVEYTRFRQTADVSFQTATQINPPVIEHFLMAGKYYLTSGWANTRATSYGYFREALKLARSSGDQAQVAGTALEVARIYWRWYEGFGYNIDGADFLNAAALLQEAYAAAPADLETYRNLAMLFLDGGRWNELEALARERLTRMPRDAWTWMTVGLARQRLRDRRGAEAVFDTAYALLDPAERARLDRFDRLMRRSDSVALASATAEERARTEAQSWARSDPLWSQDEESPRVEFLARLAHAELRWSVPERGERGADTDRGNIFVRYGPPDSVEFAAPPVAGEGAITESTGAQVTGSIVLGARDGGIGPGVMDSYTPTSLGKSSGVAGHTLTRWKYPGMDFDFLGMRTYGHSCFRDSATALRVVDARPHSWDNIADVKFDSMPTQVARFRAPGDSVDVFISAFAPFQRIRDAIGVDVPVRSAFWIQGVNTADTLATSVAIPRDSEIRWIPRVSAGTYYYRVETTADGGLAAGRATNTVDAGPGAAGGFTTRGFGMSDVLLSSAAQAGAGAARWRDVELTPVLGGLVRAGSLALVWENYDFTRDGDAARYAVAIHMERDTRGDQPGAVTRIAAQIVGGVANLLGVNRREESNGVTFEFERAVPFRAVLLDNVMLDLADTPPGRYRLTVTVTDRGSGGTTSRTLPVTIVR